MDYIRECHVYDGTKCNCPERVCRRQQAEDDIRLQELEEQKQEQRRLELLIDFQLFLNDVGLINNYDWDYEDRAKQFLNQNLLNERN